MKVSAEPQSPEAWRAGGFAFKFTCGFLPCGVSIGLQTTQQLMSLGQVIEEQERQNIHKKHTQDESPSIYLNFFLLLILREREILMWKQNIDCLPPACLPGIKPATQACTWPGIEPSLQCMELRPTNWATIARASTLYLQKISPSVFYNLSWKWHITSVIHTNPRTMWEGFTQNFVSQPAIHKTCLSIRYDIKWRPQLVVLECLPWVRRHCAWHFIHIILFNSCSKSIGQTVFSSFYWWRN